MPYEVIRFDLQSLRQAFWTGQVPVETLGLLRQIDYLHGYLEKLGCATIVVEGEYVDGDYLDDYAQYYAKCFEPYARFCKRVHFFSNRFDTNEFTSLIQRRIPAKKEKAFVNSYLGFSVAKPLPEAIIGRTVLKTYPRGNRRRHFPGIRYYKINLYGLELTVDSLAFQEQDTVVGACATSALWSAFQKACYLFGKETPTPASITQKATRHVLSSRVLPSHGLNLEQMCEAIRAAGLEPEVFPVSSHVPVVSLIYAYLRAGLPVILAIDVERRGLHAVTLLGYSVEESLLRTTEVSPGRSMLPLTGLRISKFYAHDDQIGPFARMFIHRGNRTYPVRFKGTWFNRPGQEAWLDPVSVIVPVYHKIRIKFLEVLKWPSRLTLFFASLGLLHPIGPLRLRWDVFLTTVNELKSSLRKSGASRPVLERILACSHPRFIWRVCAYQGDSPLFEVLADATGIARSFLPYLIWYQHAGFEYLIGSQLDTAQWDARVTRSLSSPFVKLFRESVVRA